MPIGILEQKYFLSPREAVEQLVGPATFGDQWEPNKISDDAYIKVVIQNMRNILQSGEVGATYTYGDGIEHELTAVKAAGDFFKIDIIRNSCYLDIDRFECGLKINKSELKSFLRKLESSGSKSTVAAELRCENWIRDLIKSGGRLPKKEELFEAAKVSCGISSFNGFQRAKNKAITAEGRDDLRRGGRPPGSRNRAPSVKNLTADPKKPR